jgi:hypothetical protein
MYHIGKWKACCDRCGQNYLNTDLRLEWTGLRTCKDCWEPRHPQDFLRGRKDNQAPSWVRPELTEIDVSPGSGNEVSAGDL